MGTNKKDIDKLNMEELYECVQDCEDIYLLLKLRNKMNDFDYDDDEIDDADDRIIEFIDSVYKIDELKKIKSVMKEYKMSTKYINKAIMDLALERYEDSDDPLIRSLDAYIESLPMEVLEKLDEENIKNDYDPRIIRKAIYNKQKRKEKLDKENRRKSIIGLFNSISVFFNIFSNTKSKGKSKDILKDYEPYQFEEEELEEDDYHYDDLD